MTIPPPIQSQRPTCWKCGYDLTGLQVTASCPECGTPVWSVPKIVPVAGAQLEQDALTWGIVSLVLFFACLGPLAGFVAIPAVIKGRRAGSAIATGRYPKQSGSSARAGLILGWITIGLSIALVALYVVLFTTGGFF